MKYLEDDDIRLRAVEPGDAGLMWEIETDSSQWRDNGMSAPYSRHNLQEYALNYDADPIRAGQIRLVCELKDSKGQGDAEAAKKKNNIVGLLDLYDISPINRTAFVGIYIISTHRGQGYSSKCIKLAERYARELLNIRILAAKVAEGNSASEQTFTRLGFEEAGVLKDWLISGNETRSLKIYTKKLN